MPSNIGMEALGVASALLISLLYPQLGSKYFCRAERLFVLIARRRRISILLCGTLALALRAVLLPVMPVPEPTVHDEFSYLLAADTFCHGRLTNPPHPMWQHFETFHVNFQPTYASMYPPAQGLVLAAGKIIGGHPFVGVWFSVGVMCAAICWMLQGWLPPTSALLGAMLAVMRFGPLSYWDNSYFGGSVPAIGGALVLGALPRILRLQRRRDALLLASGLAILANSRPYEGLLTSLPVAGALLAWMVGTRRPPVRIILRRVILPVGLLLAGASCWTGFYLWRVTGSPFRMPYELNRVTYAAAPYFFFRPAGPVPVYRHELMRRFYLKLRAAYLRAQTAKGLARETALKIGIIGLFYFRAALSVPLVALPWVFRDRRIKWLVIAGATCLAGALLPMFYAAHYVAPVCGAILAVVVQGMRHIRAWRWEGKESGLFLARALVLVCVAMVALQIKDLSARGAEPDTWHAASQTRAKLMKQLEALPDLQLVLVRYKPDHDVLIDWVYNEADIDDSKVVWARDMGQTENEDLLHYFKGHRVWLLEPDEKPVKLSAYNSTGE